MWPARELRAALDRELRPLALAVAGTVAVTFEDLLEEPSPLAMLRTLKEAAKRKLGDREGDCPPDVALLLYYGSIAVALLRHGARISRLSDEKLRQGFGWAFSQRWLGEPMRRFFAKAAEAVGTGQWRCG